MYPNANPKSEIKSSKSKIQNLHKKELLQNPPKSKIQIPKSKIQNPRSKIRNPKSKLRNPKSKIQDPKSKIQDPKSKIRNPKLGHRGAHIKNCYITVKNPKSKFQNPKNRAKKVWILGGILDLGFWIFRGRGNVPVGNSATVP